MLEAPWHYLQISDALDREFVSALAKLVPVIGWQPVMRPLGFIQNGAGSESELTHEDPPLRIRKFPMQKGYARPPFSSLARIGTQVTRRLTRQSAQPEMTPLICSTPYYAPVAERWRGPVIYYLTDLMAAYGGADEKLVQSLDRRICSAATLVCPNSNRLANYLMSKAECPAHKIKIIPNATRQSNILPSPLIAPSELPDDASDLPRPVAGVIGNMAGNLNWALLKQMVEGTPEYSWLFVGPTNMALDNQGESAARQAVLQMGGRVRFVGRKPYGALVHYARGIDVAMLPYFRREPTFSGSSTRFYEHLAACWPMIATRGFEELLHKEPLLKLIDSPGEGIQALRELLSRNFDDGQISNRWLASQQGTWEVRAATMMAALLEQKKAAA
ncbi:MAG: hypothetical protein M3Y24_06415 [Acidobacteriota bacterium]|nr:hypothetical protein [Acidobacteriota bacterium]